MTIIAQKFKGRCKLSQITLLLLPQESNLNLQNDFALDTAPLTTFKFLEIFKIHNIHNLLKC